MTATLQYKEAEVDPEDVAIKLTLKGLRGGHSGLEINQAVPMPTSCWYVSSVKPSLNMKHAWQAGRAATCAMPFPAKQMPC